MLRIITVIILSVFAVVQTGCDKIKTELERRHLGAQTHKQSLHSNSQTHDASPVKQNDVKDQPERKQIVFRIDLPADEKIQIRLIKSPIPEEDSKSDIAPLPKEELKQALPSKAKDAQDDSRKSADPEKTPPPELTESKGAKSESELKSDAEPKPQSELKTNKDERTPASLPEPAPTVVVPAREASSQPILSDENELSALSRSVKSNPTPVGAGPHGRVDEVAPPKKLISALPASNQEPTLSAAVGSALTVTPPKTTPPSSSEPLKASLDTIKPSSQGSWSIPNAEYPLRYY